MPKGHPVQVPFGHLAVCTTDDCGQKMGARRGYGVGAFLNTAPFLSLTQTSPEWGGELIGTSGETPHPTKREGYCLSVAGVVQGLPPYGVPASLIPAGSSERLPPPVLDALAGIFEVGC